MIPATRIGSGTLDVAQYALISPLARGAEIPTASKCKGSSDDFGAKAWIVPRSRTSLHRLFQSTKCFFSARLTEALFGLSRDMMITGTRSLSWRHLQSTILNPANDAPERKTTSVRVPRKSLRITSVESSASTWTTPTDTRSSLNPSNHTATSDVLHRRDLTPRSGVDGPSSMPTALRRRQVLLEGLRYMAE
jgi:hypothetical protein